MDTSHRFGAERMGTEEKWQQRAGSDPRPFVLVLVLGLLVF